MTQADKIIARAHRLGPALCEAIAAQWGESVRDADRAKMAGRGMIEKSARARSGHLLAAWAAIKNQLPMPSLGAMIVALNAACRLLDIPAHERTAIAVAYEQEREPAA